MLKVKLSECLPFPTDGGFYIRLCFMDSPKKKDSLIVVQGQVLLFEDETVIELDKGKETTPEVVRLGDEMSAKGKILVAYLKIESCGITKNPAKNPPPSGQGPPNSHDIATEPPDDTVGDG